MKSFIRCRLFTNYRVGGSTEVYPDLLLFFCSRKQPASYIKIRLGYLFRWSLAAEQFCLPENPLGERSMKTILGNIFKYFS